MDSTDEKLASTNDKTNKNENDISDLEKRLEEIASRNNELEDALVKHKSDTDRVGEKNHDSNNHNLMNRLDQSFKKNAKSFFCSKFINYESSLSDIRMMTHSYHITLY